MLQAAMVLADGPSAEGSYGALLISGGVTIVVALIAAWASRSVRKHNENPDPEPDEDENEPQWLKDMRADNRQLRRQSAKDNETMREYERILYLWGIDPETGRRLVNALDSSREEHPPNSTTSPSGQNRPSPRTRRHIRDAGPDGLDPDPDPT